MTEPASRRGRSRGRRAASGRVRATSGRSRATQRGHYNPGYAAREKAELLQRIDALEHEFKKLQDFIANIHHNCGTKNEEELRKLNEVLITMWCDEAATEEKNAKITSVLENLPDDIRPRLTIAGSADDSSDGEVADPYNNFSEEYVLPDNRGVVLVSYYKSDTESLEITCTEPTDNDVGFHLYRSRFDAAYIQSIPGLRSMPGLLRVLCKTWPDRAENKCGRWEIAWCSACYLQEEDHDHECHQIMFPIARIGSYSCGKK